jgi:hypothetical protein
VAGYKLGNIRNLLADGFNRTELLELCFDEPALTPVYEDWSEGCGKRELARRIVDYAHKKLVMEIVLDWAKTHNPRKYEENQPYYEQEAAETANSLGQGVGLVLADNDLGWGLTLGGLYQGIPLKIAATGWAEYGTSGLVRSGWLFIPQWTASHAVAFFKVHVSEEGSGYIHIVDVADPIHTIWLTTKTGWKQEESFHYLAHSAALWRFVWQG